jgi:hypothetical protein
MAQGNPRVKKVLISSIDALVSDWDQNLVFDESQPFGYSLDDFAGWVSAEDFEFEQNMTVVSLLIKIKWGGAK